MTEKETRGVVGSGLWGLVATLVLLAGPTIARAEEGSESKTKVDLYGFAMLDMGYQAGQNDPDWYDVLRPTKLPSFDNEFGEDGRFFAGVRQSRFGVKSFTPTKAGELKTIFEFELFGTGTDAGQTTFRLRHAWGELGQVGAGQTWSPFMDPDVFPNSIEYWGPTGMVFFRNVQLRWTPIQGDHTFMVALERPGASGDPGIYLGREELNGISARFPLPDLSSRYRWTGGWGHLQAAGIVRQIKWDDTLANTPGHAFDLSGSVTGWGVNVSTNVKFRKDTLRASVVYGEGIENYMNDATVDVGILEQNPLNPNLELGEALPVLGLVAFYDRTWSDKLTSTIGYSMIDIDNSSGQAASAFSKGQYALVNLLYYPAPNVMLGPELQWGSRNNHSDGYSVDDFRVQFSARYSFNYSLGRK